MREAVIVEAIRTPLGKRGGALKDVHPVDLLAKALNELFARTGVDPATVQDNITGCVSQVGEQSINIGRNGWLAAGLPDHVPATTIDRQCGSSQQAAHFGAQAVMSGAMDIVVASGVESMTRIPMGSSLGSGLGFPFTQSIADRYPGGLVPQGISAEIIAGRWGLAREDVDRIGLRSPELAQAAAKEGGFESEIFPIKGGDNDEVRAFDTAQGLR